MPTKPTIGADFWKKEVVIEGSIVNLQIWDTAGQEKYQSLGFSFYRGADACALVFDITNRESFSNLQKWRESCQEHSQAKDPEQFPFLLIGNKLDRERDRRVTTEEAKAWCQD